MKTIALGITTLFSQGRIVFDCELKLRERKSE